MRLKFKNISIWITVLIAFLILFVLTFSKQGFYNHYLLKKELSELQNRIDSLKNVNDSLTTEINLLKSNSEKIEKVAREKYGLIKPGEKIYKIEIEE